MRLYKLKESDDYKNYRNNLRDCYAYVEEYCRVKYNSGNYLDLLSKESNLIESCKNEIIHLIKEDYIKSHSYNFKVRPVIKSATDLLRNELLNSKSEHNYLKTKERAVYELLQVIRDNLTHQGKLEFDEYQYNRNFTVIKYASLILSKLVECIEAKN